MTRQRFTLLVLGTAYRLAMGIALAAPVAVVFAGVVGEHPQSDQVLWRSGGYWLLESGRLVQDRVVAPALGGGLAVFALAMGWVLVSGAFIAHVADEELDGLALALRAVDRFAPLTVLYGVTVVGQVLAVGIMAWLGGHFASPQESGDFLRWGMLAAGFVAAALMAMGHDAARVVCVQHRPGAWALIQRTFDVLAARSFQLVGAALWRGVCAWLVFLVALIACAPLLREGGLAVALAMAIQVLAVGAYVFLRMSWFQWLACASRGEPAAGAATQK